MDDTNHKMQFGNTQTRLKNPLPCIRIYKTTFKREKYWLLSPNEDREHTFDDTAYLCHHSILKDAFIFPTFNQAKQENDSIFDTLEQEAKVVHLLVHWCVYPHQFKQVEVSPPLTIESTTVFHKNMSVNFSPSCYDTVFLTEITGTTDMLSQILQSILTNGTFNKKTINKKKLNQLFQFKDSMNENWLDFEQKRTTSKFKIRRPMAQQEDAAQRDPAPTRSAKRCRGAPTTQKTADEPNVGDIKNTTQKQDSSRPNVR